MQFSRIVAVLVASSVVAAAGCGGDESDGAGPIERGLEQIPLAAYEQALDVGDLVQIDVADIAAIAELRDLDAPVAGRDDDEVADDYVALLGVSSDSPEVDLLGSPFSQLGVTAVEPYREELGVELGAVTSMAALVAPPVSFAAFTGDLSVSSSLVDVGDGVLSTRDDEDGAVDPSSRGVDPLGRPVRVVERDDTVAVSGSTELVAEWVDGDFESLADAEPIRQAAEALDDAGALSALIVEADFGFGSPLGGEGDEASVEPLDQPFDVVAVGGGEVDGEVVLITAYVFADDAAAADSVDALETNWGSEDLSAGRGRPVGDLVDLVSVEQSGDAVVVIAEPLEESPVRLGTSFLATRAPLFAHR